jgi:hypothetical protein
METPKGINLPPPEVPGVVLTPEQRAKLKLAYAELIQSVLQAEPSESAQKAVADWNSTAPETPRLSEVGLRKKIAKILQDHSEYTNKLNAALLGLME